MSTETKKLTQKDYLKKYLSGPSDDKKKKKKKKTKEAVVGAKVKVIDDDMDLSKLQPLDDSALDLYQLNEDAPQIVGVLDERPVELQVLDQYKHSQRWKVLGDSDGDGLTVSELHGSKQVGRDSPTSDPEEDFNIRPVSKSSSKGKPKDIDSSPPRLRRQNDSEKSPPRRKKQYDSDESPPRKNKQYDSDESPPRKKRQNDSDESPPRKGKQKESSASLSKRRQNDSDGSPHRKRRQDNSDALPPRRRKAYDSDASPPRKGGESPPRKKNTSDSSYVKRLANSQQYSKKHGYDSDASPPRKRAQNYSDTSPSQRSRNNDSNPSPPRKRLPRKNSEEHDIHKIKIKKEKDDDEGKKDKMKKTLDGKAAGLQDARKLKQELMDLKQREEEAFQKMDHSLSGRGAVAVQRDRKTGLKRDLEREQAEQTAKDEKDKKHKEKYTRWGKGLKQAEDQQDRFERDTYEMSKPLARYADDKDLDSYLKDQDREGDPMLEYLRNKKTEESKSKVPLYQGAFPPNRYNIRPGYRWDGVDRSNGYEKKRFEAMNAKKAVEEEAYKWSTSDM